MGRLVELWRSLTDEQKEPWVYQAIQDKQRYDQETLTLTLNPNPNP